MATDPNEHPAHKVPEEFPLLPSDLPPSTEPPTLSPQPQLPNGSCVDPCRGEVENEEDDPVGRPPRM